jgi:hypothetical protein
MASPAAATALAEGYVVGVENGTVEPRREIDEFVLDKDMLNLFLLALENIQDERHFHEPFSWFQISGKHRIIGTRRTGMVQTNFHRL